MQIQLSTQEVVHIKDTTWTHKLQKEFTKVLFRDPNPDGNPRAEAFYEAYESLFPTFIEKIVKDGKEKPYSQEWLDELPKDDYSAIQRAVDSISESAREAGKKNP